MAKARITEAGNVKLTMSMEQFNVLQGIFNHVRLGHDNDARAAFSQLVIDIEKDIGTWEYHDEYEEISVTGSIVDDSCEVVVPLADNFCIEIQD